MLFHELHASGPERLEGGLAVLRGREDRDREALGHQGAHLLGRRLAGATHALPWARLCLHLTVNRMNTVHRTVEVNPPGSDLLHLNEDGRNEDPFTVTELTPRAP